MKRFRFLTAAAALIALSIAPAFASTTEWDVDGTHSYVTFSVRNVGIIDAHGMFPKCSGTLQIDDEVITNSKVTASVDATSLITGVAGRDKRLLSADFFDVTKFPTMNFESTKIWKAPDGALKMTGNLTIHGVTKEITFDIVSFTAPVDNVMNATRRGITAKAVIDRRDFGMMTLLNDIGSQVAIELQIDALKAGTLKTPARGAAAPAAN